MPLSSLRFRQIHLDFHTSPDIAGIGAQFNKKHWQETLRMAEVNSITCFAKCHHGWSYHPTKVGKTHPKLGFDLLRAQFEACKEIDVNVPIYISAGMDDLAAYEHPEWREMGPGGGYIGWNQSPLVAGYKTLDFHSPYLDYLCEQIEEVVTLFPDCDGIFLDIISQANGCGRWSMDYMLAHGLDPESPQDRAKAGEAAKRRYYERATAACRRLRPDMPVVHNSGHIARGNLATHQYQTHLELESLPTGGWGYDHFPESAKFAVNLGKDFLGMTGKFHTTWSEFGGFKHPNALRYECAAMIAHGARCSVGDQLHPDGRLDETTYAMIGEAYRELAAKEAWCVGAEQIAEIGVLSSEAENPETVRKNHADTGVTRILLEGHHLFKIYSREMDFSACSLLILPDDILIDDGLKAKIDEYLAKGGKLLLTGRSGLQKDGSGFAFETGAEWFGDSPFEPDYTLPSPEVCPAFVSSPMVMYFRSQRIKATSGCSLGSVYDPYFNRSYRQFSGHQHTPSQRLPSGYDCGVISGNIAYLAHPVFSIYRGYGAVAMKAYVLAVIRKLLGEPILKTNLPSAARVTLARQEAERRWVLHLLYASTINRAGVMPSSSSKVPETKAIEVIEDLLPLYHTEVRLRIPGSGTPGRVKLEPEGREIPFRYCAGEIQLTVECFACHQMIVIEDL